MNENESVEDVLHDMRCAGHSDIELGFDSEAERLRGFIVRIEAAYKRGLAKAAEEAASRAILNRDAKDAAEYAAQALNAQPDARGNIAALREALENARSKFIHIKKCADEGEVSRKKLTILCEFVSQEIAAALAAPPRNCDKGFRDIEEYRLAFRRECQSHEDCADCPISKTDAFKNGVLCFFSWLLSADEGGAE